MIEFLFFIVATIYSSAGLAGGSSYLALLYLLDYPVEQVSVIALICNIIVSLIGTKIFIFTKNLDYKNLFWYLLGSIPFAFIAGYIKIPKENVKIILGILLLISSFWILLLTFIKIKFNFNLKKTKLNQSLVGSIIGFLSGLVGIGGGIFLAPVLILFQWEENKKATAITASFILLNSLSGIFGHLSKLQNVGFISDYLTLFLVVVVGGVLGPYLNLKKFNDLTLKRVTGGLILFASLRLIFNI